MGIFTCTKVLNPNKGYSCVFRQPAAASHCHNWHGYDLIFATTLECDRDRLDLNGWVYDYGGFKVLDEVIKKHFDHKWVIAENDPLLNLTKAYIDQASRMGLPCGELTVLPRVGCEAFALWLAVEATNMLQDSGDLGRVRVRSTTVSEHGGNHATYIP